MRVVIVGAGEVGENIASNLADSHEVVVIDVDADKVEQLTYTDNILGIHGNGSSLSVLEEADIAETDLLIASTDDDETNLVTCETAKTVGDPVTVARVKDVKYLRTWERASGTFGVDHMVCTNLLAAENIIRIIGHPAAHDVDPFAGGLVRMAELEIGPNSPVVDQLVEEADRWGSLTFAAIIRDDEVLIPRGATRIRAGDRIVVIGSPESVRSSAAAIAAEGDSPIDDVVIFGASAVGFHVARLLGEQGIQPRIVEQDETRARDVAERLPDALVMQADATNVEFLSKERVSHADAVVAALENDQQNLLVCLIAERLGVDRTIAVVEVGEYVEIFEAVGVDVAINPRQVVAEELTQFTREFRSVNVSMLEDDRAEVLEIEIDADSALANRTIQAAVPNLPGSVVIGALTRDEERITPRGDTVIRPGDHVVLFAETEDIDGIAAKV